MSNEPRKKQNLVRRVIDSKYLKREVPPNSAGEIILWWELRRVPYNLAVGIAGLVTCVIWLACLTVLTAIPEVVHDPESPMVPDGGVFAVFGVILYAVAANVCFTGGWIVEVLAFRFAKQSEAYFGPMSFALGTAFSLLLTLAPAVFFVVYTLVKVFGS